MELTRAADDLNFGGGHVQSRAWDSVEKLMEACEREGIREQLSRELASDKAATAARDWAVICQALLDEVEALERRLRTLEKTSIAGVPPPERR